MEGFHYAGVVKHLHIKSRKPNASGFLHSISPLTRKRFTISM